jgi:hypothetical protein
MKSKYSEVQPGTDFLPTPKEKKSIGLMMSNNNPKRISMENDKYMVTFYYSHAIVALIINITHLFFGPFIIPGFNLVFGKNLMHALIFRFDYKYLKGDFTNWAWVISSIVFAYMYSDQFEGLAVVYTATGSVILLRQIMVSIKYGYYTKKKWESLINTQVSFEYIISGMILRAWVKIPQEIAKTEIILSLRKLKMNPESLIFKFSQLDCKSLEFDELSELQSHYSNFAEKKVFIGTLALFIIKKITENQKTFELKLIKLFGMIYVLFMVILRIYAFKNTGYVIDPVEIIYVGFSCIKAYVASTQFVSFIAAGLYDFKRKKLLMTQCMGLISRLNPKETIFDCKVQPRIDLNDPVTVMTWYYLRRSFLDFGKRYTLRVFMYASLVFPVCIVIVIILVLQLIGIVGVSYNFYLIPSLFMGLIVFGVIIHMALAALSLNNSFAVHRDLLLENLNQIGSSSNFNSDAGRNLKFVIQKLRHDAIFRPIRIIGITINEAFIINIIAISISGIFAVIKML